MPTFTVHFKGNSSGEGAYVHGAKVGGPYQTKQRARSTVDRLDNKYGAYVHTIKEHPDTAGNYGAGHDMTTHGEGKPHGE